MTTYRALQKLMGTFTDEQLDANITVELSTEDECYPAELRIAGEEHDSLDVDHPIIFVP